MTKKVNFAYILFILFTIFIFYSFFFILQINKKTKNNYLAIEKIESLNRLNNSFNNVLSKKLQYIDTDKILKDIVKFENELNLLNKMIEKQESSEIFYPYLEEIESGFKYKEKILSEFKKHNYLLVSTMQKLIDIQPYIQKRYYFSPIGLEINAIIVNLTQSALGKKKFSLNIEKNIKKVEDLERLYKLTDRQLDEFIIHSYTTLKHLKNIQTTTAKNNMHKIENSINKLKVSLVSYFNEYAEKEENFSFFLVLIIISFLITLIITYHIDKRHKQKLLEQTKKLNEAQKFAHLGSWEIDVLNKKINMSKEMYKICDINTFNKKINFKTFLYVIYKNDRKKILANLKNYKNNERFGPFIHKIVTKSGETKYAETRWTNIYDENNNLVKTLGITLDITNEKILEVENKKQEEIMYQQSKMAAMGEMIGNIAHQWRQPLSVISTSSTGAKLQKELGVLSDKQFNESMDLINENAQYLSETINDFRNFIKGERGVITYNLENTINSFLHLVNPNIKNHQINLVLNLSKDISLEGRPNELVQCLINIFNNSKDAFSSNSDEEKFLFISTEKIDNYVLIKMKDSAGGIPIKVLPKIFDPYFTTKHQSQGTGIGLHMTYNIIVGGMKGHIEAHNVVYDYKNKTHVGAEFKIKLPI